MDQSNRALLEQGLRMYGLEPSAIACDGIIQHLQMVAEWNERINLTAITAEREMVVKHALDSASGARWVELGRGMRVLDVGTGAGFPGVTWKCLYPAIDLVLLESLQKRCRFLEEVGERVILPLAKGEGSYRVVWGRAEDVGRMAEHREQYHVVTARAVAELRVLAEYCLPFVKVGGLFLALKGPAAGDEVEGARRGISELGGQLERIQELELPGGGGGRSLILVRKVRATPKGYPRRAGTPAKNPL